MLAEVGGNKLTQQDFQRHFAILCRACRSPSRTRWRCTFPGTCEGEIQKMALLYVAKQMGLTVSDDEVLVGIESQWPQFFQNGVVNKDQFEQYLASIGITLQEATDTDSRPVDHQAAAGCHAGRALW